jgi:hypothetical protein
MQMQTTVLVLSLAAVLASGCAATPPADAAAAPREEKVYRTGSNIPVRDASAPSATRSVDAESWERARSTSGIAGKQDR